MRIRNKVNRKQFGCRKGVVGALAVIAYCCVVLTNNRAAVAQGPAIRFGSKVPSDVKLIYERGLKHLASTQSDDGSWPGGQRGGGITGLCLMAFLAHGEDPNFGPYSVNVRRAVRNIIQSQNASTGYIPNSMYHHGFGMLGLSEAYGAVDESLLWEGTTARNQRTIGQSLELAVRSALTAQKRNKMGGWRYSPTSTDADTSVSGAVLMGLLAARNAGIEVPDYMVPKSVIFQDRFPLNTSGKVDRPKLKAQLAEAQ